jgi:hypothetical protein
MGITLEELEGRDNEQMPVPLPLPRQYSNPVILLGEPVYQVAAYEARATHYSQGFELHTLKLISRKQMIVDCTQFNIDLGSAVLYFQGYDDRGLSSRP